jgi:hypothetical protein
MKTFVIGCLTTCAALALCAAPAPAFAQDDDATKAPAADASGGAQKSGASEIYTPEDFARFAPRTALDMIDQVPGFTVEQSDQGRGLGQANQNVLLNGERLASKSDSVVDQLSRIPANRVVRIEIVDGAQFGIPGLSGQVANVITKGGGISGRFEYRANFRPKYAKPSYGSGEISVSGTTDTLEWNAALTEGVGRGAAGGGRGTIIYDGLGNITETREKHLWFKGEFPQISGRIKWNAPGGTIVNLSATYGRNYTKFADNEYRHPIGGVSYHRNFLNRDNGYDYDLSGDVEFGLGPGRLKLIGIERFEQSDGPATSYLIYDDGRPDEGSWFYTDSKSGERIARAEYRWDMLGGNWELDGEAAFNRLNRIATVGSLMPNGEFDIQPLPAGGGNVTEDRYESILTHNRTLADGLTLQIGVGGEYSKLSQTGPNGLTREFWRPKGSLTLAWTAENGLDMSLKLSRTVGQLSFGTFLATVDLQNNNQNAGNVRLVPQQAWEGELQVKKNLGKWGSATVRGYGQLIEDYIDIVPVPGGESLGNIDGKAKLLGISLNATINLDPLGWKGAKITTSTSYEHTSLPDPLTGRSRPFSGQTYLDHDSSVRWDVPKSNWALGAGFQSQLNEDYVRLYETGVNYEGPIYTYAFIENKDVFGLTVSLNVFNLTGGESINKRYVYSGLRDRSPLLFVEDVRNDISTIYRISVKGSF